MICTACRYHSDIFCPIDLLRVSLHPAVTTAAMEVAPDHRLITSRLRHPPTHLTLLTLSAVLVAVTTFPSDLSLLRHSRTLTAAQVAAVQVQDTLLNHSILVALHQTLGK